MASHICPVTASVSQLLANVIHRTACTAFRPALIPEKKKIKLEFKEIKRKPHPKITEELLKPVYNDSFLTDESLFFKQDRPLLLDSGTASLTSLFAIPE